ncbi:RNA polymerase sigma-70 factor [Desmospora activa]|uniref:RNA polymerase sigma-70 factor n=1 Tax=Desmospora activa TaxID=500615 RepID=UPI001B87EBEE|nr:RNA polymerase sigma-70 factor [Desmospora activa]
MEIESYYQSYKPLLFSLAYRMLGSVSDAEDIVQDVFLTLDGLAEEEIRQPKSYLCKMVTNRCIDHLRSAANQRETYMGTWLPEPYVTASDDHNDPIQRYLRKEEISTAYLFLMEQLTWVERVVFLLREVLQYDYEVIAEIVGKSRVNCRQIYHRAKKSVGDLRDKKVIPEEETAELVTKFAESLLTGNVQQLLGILSEDAILYSDGGGKVQAALRPIQGLERISSFFQFTLPKLPADFSIRFYRVNGQMGLVTTYNGATAVISFEIQDNQIQSIYGVANPDKVKLP